MSFKNFSLLIIATSFLMSCHASTATKTSPSSKAVEAPVDKSKKLAPSVLLGLDEGAARQMAREHDTPFRVVKRDGKDMIVTMDYVKGRINATVKDGVVQSYRTE